MSNIQPIDLVSDMLEKGQASSVDLYIQVTSGALAFSPVGSALGSAVLMGTSAAAPLDQTTIDAFIGASEIVAATAFSSTALGTDAMGYVINLQGQCKQVVGAEAVLYAATIVSGGVVASTSALTSSLSSAVTITTLGNIYGRFVLTGLDAATCLLRITVHFYAK